MSSRTVGQNITSGIIAGAIALVIYVVISALFNGAISGRIILVGLGYGIVTLVLTFLISRIISVSKARG